MCRAANKYNIDNERVRDGGKINESFGCNFSRFNSERNKFRFPATLQ